jgi:pimeloyl-ACP methyl ester carboxylesterase
MDSIQSVKLNNTTLYYALEGNGNPCFVIGFGRYMRRVLSQTLRKHFQFVFTDFRGLNPADTAFDIATLSLQNLLDDIEALRQFFGFESIVRCHPVAQCLAIAWVRDASL